MKAPVPTVSTTEPIPAIAPSGWGRTREILWHMPRILTSHGPEDAHGEENAPPALVIPGFLASDKSTWQIRRAMGRYGWRAHPWGLGVNKGAYETLLAEMEERVDAVGEGRKVLLVGWSLGGLYAREIARACPHKVRGVVTLASPFCGDLKTNTNIRWLYEWVAGHDVNEPPFPRLEDKPPVPTIAFWSRKDGVVAPRAACGEEEHCDRQVEVDTNHMGFAMWRPALSRIMRHTNRFIADVEGADPVLTKAAKKAARTAYRQARKNRRAGSRPTLHPTPDSPGASL